MCPTWDATARRPLCLAVIAQAVGVPVVILSKGDAACNAHHWTYGLELATDSSAMAFAFYQQSEKATTVIPNLALHPDLSQWSSAFVARDLRFMVGLPLYDNEGQRVGSISVVASQKDVAARGIPIAMLKKLGCQFVAQSS